MKRAKIVFGKEIADNLRDRRSVLTAFFYALIGPIVLVPMLLFESRTLDRGTTKTIRVAVEGADEAPGLVEYLRQRSIETRPAPADPAQAVRDLEVDLVLVIPRGYADDFRAGRPATVKIVTDQSRTTAAGEISRVTNALDAYSGTVGALRLVARGVNPAVLSAVAVAIDDVATPESKGALLLAIVPIFLLTTLFFGGVYVAVDVTAGERERGSLEPLMSTPLSAAEIVLGKLGAVIFFSLATTLVTLVAFGIVINLPFAEVPGIRFKLSPLGVLTIVGALVPLFLPVASLQMIIASRSRTVKEAFTATSICSLVPMVPGFLLIFAPFKSTTTSMLVPVLAQTVVVNQVLGAGTIRALDYALAAGSTTALGVALAAVAVATCAQARMLADR